ncbi:MAG: hypothetical protein OEX04_11190 [Acidimicrobiia bacterium]|nr:hypothetical protein [Acidimicrobiia bacterium]MDH4308033.1 hypothetical protein [Acidimicrobiia bacterium]
MLIDALLERGDHSVAAVLFVVVEQRLATGDRAGAAREMERIIDAVIAGEASEDLVLLTSTLASQHFMADLHMSADADLPGLDYGAEDGYSGKVTSGNLWLSSAQLEALFARILPSAEARQVFLLGSGRPPEGGDGGRARRR